MLRSKPIIAILSLVAASLVAAACGGGAAPTASECQEAQDGVLVDTPCEVPGITPDPTPTPSPSGNGNGGTANPGLAGLLASGCGACHVIDSVAAAAGSVGPDLSHAGSELSADLIRQSIVDPGAVIAEDCPSGPCPDGVMPANFGTLLSAQQLDDLVDFLSSLQ